MLGNRTISRLKRTSRSLDSLSARMGSNLSAEASLMKAASRACNIAAESIENAMDCYGCKHRWFVRADPLGTSSSGWGCRRTGGHAWRRCEHFTETE